MVSVKLLWMPMSLLLGRSNNLKDMQLLSCFNASMPLIHQTATGRFAWTDVPYFAYCAVEFFIYLVQICLFIYLFPL